MVSNLSEYSKKILKQFTDIFNSPVEDLYKYCSSGSDQRYIIQLIINESYDRKKLRNLLDKVDNASIRFTISKRIRELSNAESFIFSIQ